MRAKFNDQNDDFDFNSKAITTGVVDERGKQVGRLSKDPGRKPGQHCLRVTKAIFTQIGLLLILLGYLAGGGYLFRTLELDNEYSECIQKQDGYQKKLNFSVSRAIGIVEAQMSRPVLESQVREALIDFADQLFVLNFHPLTNCSAILYTTSGAKWSLANSVYFCATLISTIGYGNIAPATFWGRLSCIIYSVIGIPLMLIYLAIIGNVLARVFRLVYVNIICCRCFYDVFRRRRQRRRERLLKWEQALRQHEEEEARRRGLPVPPPKVQATVIDEDDELDNAGINGEVVAVPLTVSIILMTGYTALGGVIFPNWETWTFMDAAYFSFISLATIGLGDLVPGNGRLGDPNTIVQLIIGAVYILFGLALLSMCFNLLQDELVAKIKYLTQCCGGGKNKVTEDEEEQPETYTTSDNDLNKFQNIGSADGVYNEAYLDGTEM
ncbi:TWiK family of potassium channels protein 7 [Clonorchis sinensis]|uniref:TWiK family of potassium channels protein 7 n=1 Tax=Clonorchis sinensis TaxID=79923 RepID=G7YHV4_CLOSI|nr:TWiK family of potassium channels protein 7 [Clonorchis sinensis]